ncbi:hypothetical protein [Streptomyces minutiscleroticus]
MPLVQVLAAATPQVFVFVDATTVEGCYAFRVPRSGAEPACFRAAARR